MDRYQQGNLEEKAGSSRPTRMPKQGIKHFPDVFKHLKRPDRASRILPIEPQSIIDPIRVSPSVNRCSRSAAGSFPSPRCLSDNTEPNRLQARSRHADARRVHARTCHNELLEVNLRLWGSDPKMVLNPASIAHTPPPPPPLSPLVALL